MTFNASSANGKYLISLDGNRSVSSITFQSAAGTNGFTFNTGTPLTSTLTIGSGGIANNDAAAQTFNVPIIVSAAQSWNAASGGLAIGAVTLGNTLTLSGNANIAVNGQLTLTANSTITNNSFGGSTFSGITGTNRSLVVGGTGNTSIGAITTGTGALTKTGTGVLTLSGANTNTGTTTISAGTLRVGTGGTIGSLGTGNVTNNGTLVLDRSNSLTMSNRISGTGAVTQAGPGTTVLLGFNTYSGRTTISGGTLQIGNGGTVGTLGTGPVTNNGTLVFNRNHSEIDGRIIASVISGTGTLIQNGIGTIWLTGTNTYTGPTKINVGTLSVGNGGATGDLGASSQVLNSGTLQINRTGAISLGQVISGTGRLSKLGTGVATLTGENTYTGGTTISAGTLQLGDGGTSGSIVGVVLNNGTFAFNRSDTLTFDGIIFGSGVVEQVGGGVTVLTANNSYLGATTVSAGTLLINGDQSGAIGPTNVASGATLGGTGTIGGDVTIANGGVLAPGLVGNVPGTLTITKNLALNDTSQLNYDFGEANVVGGPLNDHTKVAGNLTLDGVINVTLSPGGSFLPGVYRVISYDGTLTNNGLDIGTMPPGPGPFFVQTAIANQVNLVNAAGLQLNYWDGDAGTKNSGVDGGNGTWNLLPGNINWTDKDGIANASFNNGDFAIFAGAKGTVAVDNASAGQVQISGMQFLTDGYVIEGGALEMVGAPTYIRVGDGTLGVTATIHSQLFGSSQLVATDPGTLVLTATNTYTGGTKIAQGATVQVSQDTSLGDLSGGLTFDVGALHTIATFQTDRTVTLDGEGRFLPDAGTTLTLGGAVSGLGSLVMGGAGELVLAAPATYAGDTIVAAGTLSAGAANMFSTGSNHSVLSGATLNLNGYDQTVAALSNAGTVGLNGPPGTTLTVTGNYTGAGGLIQFNTVLNVDASPTDRLVVQGDTSGSTDVKVTNVGGTGAQTVKGIKIVDVGGASNGAFTLQGDYVFHGEQAVIGGAYAYTLHKNGVSTPTDGDWYLRSALINPPPVVPPGPIYQPGVALYENYPQILLQLMHMPTLRDRVGDRYASAGSFASAAPAAVTDGDDISYLGGSPRRFYEEAPAVRDSSHIWWGRVDASRISIEPSHSTAGATYDADQVRLQTGFDALLHTDASGRLMGGFTVQQGMSSAHVQSVWGNGKLDTNGHGIGGTLTWYGNSGLYVDGQAQVNWFDTDIQSSLAGAMKDGDDVVGYGVSIETGKRFAAGGPWSITPQAQLAYTHADFNFVDNFGASVSAEDGDSLLGRLGIALDYRIAAGPARSNIYGIANLYYEFLEGTSVDVGGKRFRSEPDQLWGGLGLGGSYSWSADKYALFGEVSVNTGLDNIGDSTSVNGKAGLRIRW